MRTSCLYCGHAPLVRVAHWGVCPKCSPEFLERFRPPSIAEQVAVQVGGLLTEKGRPTVNGQKR